MAEIKKRGILARPGEYKFGDTVEIKTAEELRLAVQRQPILMLTHGHPTGGIPMVSDYIGTVAQKWNEEKQRVDGDFWFYDEHIPTHIRERIVNNEPVQISAGYTVDDVEEGIQKGILYSHIAILRDEEDPTCPLDKCGVNVRMETNSKLRYEQEQDIDEPEEVASEEKPEVPKTEPHKASELWMIIGEMRAEIKALKESKSVPAPPAVQKPEVEEVIEEVPEEPSTPTPPEPRMEPEKVIPTAPSSSEVEYATKDDMMAVSIKILGDKKKK